MRRSQIQWVRTSDQFRNNVFSFMLFVKFKNGKIGRKYVSTKTRVAREMVVLYECLTLIYNM